MRIGLIARCDNTGLGIQSWEFFNHIDCKALVIDFSAMAPHESVLTPYLERFPGQQVYKWGNVHNRRGDMPTEVILEFIKDIDILFTMETPYDYNIYDICRSKGVKTILQLNYEFLDYPSSLPKPDLFAAPSMWNYEDIPEPKIFLPVPVNTSHFNPILKPNVFVHIAGRPAAYDRNGTRLFLDSLHYVKKNITVVLCQKNRTIPSYKSNIKVILKDYNTLNYWDNYQSSGVLVMPRKYGGLCLPMNEAIASCMPVITTDISPNNLWLPKDWLIPAFKKGSFQSKKTIDYYEINPEDLAAKIEECCNMGFYVEYFMQAEDLKRKISWTALLPRYMEVFNNLIQ